eukprot:9237669-Pyramimonas_sp.AAC.1
MRQHAQAQEASARTEAAGDCGGARAAQAIARARRMRRAWKGLGCQIDLPPATGADGVARSGPN